MSIWKLQMVQYDSENKHNTQYLSLDDLCLQLNCSQIHK